MSKTITILEGGSTKQMTAEKLKIDLYSGGSSIWVPEDETRLTTKHITENGTYVAEDDGYYGYSAVTVNVQGGNGTVSGLDPDGSGDSAVAWIDPITGGIEMEKVPSRIEVVIPPNKTMYSNGESIDTTGMVVKAYYESGGEWGVVPLSEITIDPTAVSFDETNAHGEYSGNGLFVNSYVGVLKYYEYAHEDFIEFVGDLRADYSNRFSIFSTNLRLNGAELCITQYDGTVYMLLKNDSGKLNFALNNGGSARAYGNVFSGVPIDYNEYILPYAGVSSVDPSGGSVDGLDSTPVATTWPITVMWNRTKDGEILTTSFNVRVTSGESEEQS